MATNLTQQNYLQQFLLRTQMGLLNNSYKTTNSSSTKNNVVSNLKTLVPQTQTAATVTTPETNNNVAANVTAGAPIKGAVKIEGDGVKRDSKAIIQDLAEEFGLDTKKGSLSRWAAFAGKSDAVNIYSKDGTQLDTDKDKKYGYKDLKNQVLVVNSKTYGQVTIQCGGDGELNGKDDKVIAVTKQGAANNMDAGLNALNTQIKEPAPTIGLTPTVQRKCTKCNGAGCESCGGTGFRTLPAMQPPLQQPAMQQAAPKVQMGDAGLQVLMDTILNESKEIIANHTNGMTRDELVQDARAKMAANGGQPIYEAGNCPICKGSGCFACKKNDEIEKLTQQMNDLAANTAVQQKAATDTQTADTVEKTQGTYTFSADEIKGLIALFNLILQGVEI